MERFIVVLLFFSVTSCQSFINEDIIFEDAAELEEVQEIVVIENEIAALEILLAIAEPS